MQEKKKVHVFRVKGEEPVSINKKIYLPGKVFEGGDEFMQWVGGKDGMPDLLEVVSGNGGSGEKVKLQSVTKHENVEAPKHENVEAPKSEKVEAPKSEPVSVPKRRGRKPKNR